VKIECEYRATIGSFRVRIFCAQVWNLPSTRIHMRVVKGAFSKLSRRLLSHLHGIAFPRKSFAFLCNLRLFRYFVHRSLLSLAVHAREHPRDVPPFLLTPLIYFRYFVSPALRMFVSLACSRRACHICQISRFRSSQRASFKGIKRCHKR
jgi:hypothetical protein